jgi:tetratricopeptide (TPR) repeat protein
MSFYKKNGMLEDMKILHGDFTARPGGMYVLDYPDIPDWSNYDGYKNNLVFALIQSISHTQIMIYTDLSLLFLRFAQIISNEANMDAINYYLGQYYFHNTGDYKTCFNRIGKTSPFYLFSQLNVAERDADFRGVKKIVHDNPLFVPAIQLLVREYIKNGDKHAALSVLNRALKHEKLPDEGRAFLLKQRAYVYLVFNDAKPAQEDLYDVKIISGNMSADLMALQARAWIVRNRNLDDAYNYAMSLIKNNTSDVYAWTLAAQVVAKKESVDNALEILESVSASGANLSVLYDVLGDLYNAQGEKEKALRAYNQALDLSDDCMIVVPNVQKKIRKLK